MRLVCRFCRANGVQRELSIVSLARTKEPVDPRNREDISFNSIQEEPIECNGEFSCEKNSSSSTTSYLWLNSVYIGELSIVSFARTKER
ncbi:hypothetical protein STEG23_007310 [Scotinomys teguina]